MQGPIKLVNTDKVTMLDPLSSWQMATQEATSTFQHAPSSQSRMPTKLTNKMTVTFLTIIHSATNTQGGSYQYTKFGESWCIDVIFTNTPPFWSY